jgi:hypothetical protein
MKKRCRILVLARHMLILRPGEGRIIIDKSGKADKLSVQRKKTVAAFPSGQKPVRGQIV